MRMRLAVFALAFVFAVTLSVSADKKDGSWTGWVTDSHCAAKGKGDSAGHADCAASCVKGQGAKYVLLTPSDKKVYQLDAQDKAAAMAGKHVKVTGEVDGDSIKVKSIEATGEQKGH